MTSFAFAMERLNFRLHDFTRYSWVSDLARKTWQPRIQRILTSRQEIEWRAVADGLQACTVQILSPEQLAEQTRKMAECGLVVLPLRNIPAQRSMYHTVLTEAQATEPFHCLVVIGSAGNVEAFKEPWEANNQREVHAFSGYPACCRDFFQEVWVQEKFLDTTWPMTLNTETKKEISPTIYEAEGPAQANILLRWISVRAASHLPCRFDCPATVERANQFLALGREAGYGEEMNWLLEMLDWPMEWSALHGIAEILMPVLKIVTLSDATAKKYVVRRKGNSYPREGARGLAFPYRQPIKLGMTGSRSFQRGLANPIHLLG